MTRFISIVLMSSLVAFMGCDDDVNTGTCVQPSDCPAGQTCANGLCIQRYADGSLDTGALPDQSSDMGTVPDIAPGDGADGAGNDVNGCIPNANGIVERAEMPLVVPAEIDVQFINDVVIDLRGVEKNGVLSWDLASLSLPQTRKMAVLSVPSWAAGDFVGADYASELMPDYGVLTKSSLLGIFKLTDHALQLRGLVSEKASHTRLRYSDPLDLLRFPLAAGDRFETSASVSGYSDIFPLVSYNESYAIDVLKRGRLELFSGLTLDSLLVRVRQKVSSPFNPLFTNSTTAFVFVAECYGTVARVIAERDPGDSLAAVSAREVWRLAAP